MLKGANVRFSLIAICVLMGIQIAHGRERMIVRLRPSADATMALRTMPQGRTLLPVEMLSAKPSDKAMSIAQRQALDVMSRYIVVDVGNAAELEALRRRADVEDVLPNRRIPLHEAVTNDALSDRQYALRTIGAVRAWARATGKGIRVGIIDTGIDWEHEDLRDQIAINRAEDINGNGRFDAWPSTVNVDGVMGDLDGIDNDGNGYVDDVIGYDFVDQDVRNVGDDRERDPVPFDEQGHGTSVAGVIAARANNEKGIAGLAYDSRVVSLRAFDATGNAEEDDVAACLVYAALNGLSVVNMSFGDGVDSPVLRDAVRMASAFGCILVASAGNTGTVSRQYPAGYDEVIAVGATNDRDQRAPFSSTGSLVALAAPGEGIWTTQVDSRYRSVNGTSFAAPYTAAAVALLMEHKSGLSPDEVRGMLQEHSVDLGETGWDEQYGAGRLDVAALVEAPGSSVVRITSLRNEQEIDVDRDLQLDVRGTVTSLLFDSYTLQIGRGIAEPMSWTTIGSGAQTVNGKLGSLAGAQLVPGLYTIRLVAKLQTGRTLEDRKRLNVVRGVPVLTDSEAVPVWEGDRKEMMITSRWSRPVTLVVEYGPQGTDTLFTWRDTRRFTRTHSILLPDAVPGALHEARLLAIADNGDTGRAVMMFTMPDEAAPRTGMQEGRGYPFAGYVVNDVRDLYDDGLATFVMNDLSGGSFGPMMTVQRDGLNFTERDTLASAWIPRGLGDSNGDGIPEIFAHVVGRAILYQARTKGGSPFGRILYADTVSGRRNAAGMADIDGDGLDDLLMLSDSGLVVAAYRNGVYKEIGMAVNTTPPPPGTANNRVDEVSVAAGDFDGDGRMEVAFGDTDGDLVIHEWTGSGFREEFVLLGDGIGGSGYVVGKDFDGDGRKDVVIGIPDSVQPNSEREYGRQAWTYRMIKATGPDTYQVIWTDRIHGVRYGIGFRNGVDGGQVDMRGGDELLVSAFPRLYIFRWNPARSTMEPMWYTEDVASPRMLTYDFDRNGVNEVGFGVTVPEVGFMTSFRFVEADTSTRRIAAPAGLRAKLRTPSTVDLTWSAVGGASRYNVYSTVDGAPVFRLLATVDAPRATFDTLKTGSVYRYRVSAVPDDDREESVRSNVVAVGAAASGMPVSVMPVSVTRDALANGISVVVVFTSMMPETDVQPHAFVMEDEAIGRTSPATSAVRGGENQLVIRFAPMSTTNDTVMLHFASFMDGRDVPTRHGTLPLAVTDAPPVRELYLTGVRVLGASSIRLAFSEAPGDGATTSSNYVLSPSGHVATAERATGDSVTLTFSPDSPLGALGVTYYVRVSDVTSLSGAPMTKGAGNTIGFVLTASDVDNVFVYPQPARLGRDAALTFANLTQSAEVEILDQRFTVIARVRERDGNGGAPWDLRTTAGDVVPPGLYFYRVTGTSDDGRSSESGLRKLMITR